MKFSLLFVFLIITNLVSAQSFSEIPHYKPIGSATSGTVSHADIDNDGDLDILVTGIDDFSERIMKLYINDGSGNYEEMTGTPFEGIVEGSVAFADVDGDGDLDLLSTGEQESAIYMTRLYLNDGSGNYTEKPGTPFENVGNSSIAFADVDGDEDKDLFITGINQSAEQIAKLYTNDGSGNFQEVVNTPFEGVYYSSVSFADVEGDADMDLFIAGETASDERIAKLYSNDGTGVFTEQNNPSIEGVMDGSSAFADVDGDGDQDLLVTGENGSDIRTSSLYMNEGSWMFTRMQNTPIDSVTNGTVEFEDVDLDGDQDLLITGNTGRYSAISKLYLNDGSGGLTENTASPLDHVSDGVAAFLDFDNDGDQDVIVIGFSVELEYGVTVLYSNDGSGNYSERSGQYFYSVESGSVAFADVDNDGDQDVLIAGLATNSSARLSKLYLNDGNGNYSVAINTPFEGVAGGSVNFSDIDGDEDQDVLITGRNNSRDGIAKLYVNDGSGNFTESNKSSLNPVSLSSADFADIDGDGDEDLFITGKKNNFFESIATLYENDGEGSFTEITGTPIRALQKGSVIFSDMEGDGDEDLLITGEGLGGLKVSRLYTNDGNGTFSELSGTPFEGVNFSSIALADVNGNSYLDVLITGQNASGEPFSKMYSNDGSNNFTEMVWIFFEDVYLSSVGFSDVDGDGDQDAIITGQDNNFQPVTELHLNDGASNFRKYTSNQFESVGYSSIAFTDVDGDGDEDVLITGRNGSGERISKVYSNDRIISSTDEVNDEFKDEINLFPNPVLSQEVYVSYKSTGENKVGISIYDLKGNLISSQTLPALGGLHTYKISVDGLPSGSYFMQLHDGDKIKSAKFIVE